MCFVVFVYPLTVEIFTRSSEMSLMIHIIADLCVNPAGNITVYGDLFER